MKTAARLTVAVDVTPLVGPRTGIGKFVAELLAAVRAHADAPEVLPYVLSRRAELSGDDVPPGTRRLPLPAGAALRMWGRTDRPALDRWLTPARVVHGTNFVAPPSRRAAVVITVHDCSFVRFPETCRPDVLAFAPVVRRLVSRGAWVHTVSEAVAAEVRDLFRTERVRVVRSGVPRLSPDPGVPPDTAHLLEAGPFVLALGRAEPRKRHAELVAAFGRLAADVPGIRLVVAGPDGPATAAVVAARDGLPGAARNAVHLLGHVDDVTRSALLRNAALLAYPSSYEGFGFPVLEAMQAGTPVVAASGGAVAEVAGDAAVLVDESGVAFVDALADALRRVVTDETLRHRLVESGHHRVEEFGWEKTAAGMVDLYREAADG